MDCKPFCVFGPRAQSEGHYVSSASTLHPQNSWSICCTVRGGEKLDGVSSTSLQGVSPGPLGNPLFFPSGKLWVSSCKLLFVFGRPCLCLCTYTVSPFCVFAPSGNSGFSLCFHPRPPNCWEYLLRPSRWGVPLDCKPFCVFGPQGAKLC